MILEIIIFLISWFIVECQEICEKGTYLKGIFGCQVSQKIACHFQCIDCRGPFNTQCLECSQAANRVLLNTRCVCAEGYYEDNRTGGLCLDCPKSCKSCDGSDGSCTSCDSNIFRQLNLFQRCQCMLGYFENSNGICEVCDNSCYDCTGPTKADCKTCIPHGYRVFKELDAQKNIGSCICQEGHYSKINICYQCRQECKTCNDANTCSSCKVGLWTLTDNLCKCFEGYYMNMIYECLICDQNCKFCRGSSYYCTDCDSSKSFVLDAYVNKCICKNGQFLKEDKCEQCHYQCNVCINEYDYCLECHLRSQRWLDLSIRKCVCKQHYYDAGVAICEVCSEKCMDCQGTLFRCISCYSNSNRFLDEVKHDCPCLEGYYDNTIDSVCSLCDALCKSCIYQEQYKCLQCKAVENLILADGACICIYGYYTHIDENEVDCKEFNKITEINVQFQTDANYMTVSALTLSKILGYGREQEFTQEEKENFNIFELKELQYNYQIELGSYQNQIDFKIDFFEIINQQMNLGIKLFRSMEVVQLKIWINYGDAFENRYKVLPNEIMLEGYQIRLHGSADILRSAQQLQGRERTLVSFLQRFNIIVYLLNAPQAIVLLFYLNIEFSQLSYEYFRVIAIMVFGEMPPWNQKAKDSTEFHCKDSNLNEENLKVMGLCEKFFDNEMSTYMFGVQLALYLIYFSLILSALFMQKKQSHTYLAMRKNAKQNTIGLFEKMILLFDWLVYKVQDAFLLKFITFFILQVKYFSIENMTSDVVSLVCSILLFIFLVINNLMKIYVSSRLAKEISSSQLQEYHKQLKSGISNRSVIYEQFKEKIIGFQTAKHQLNKKIEMILETCSTTCKDVNLRNGSSSILYFHQIQTLKKIMMIVLLITLYRFPNIQIITFMAVLLLNLIFKLSIAPYLLSSKNQLSLVGDSAYLIGVALLIWQGKRISYMEEKQLMQEFSEVRNAQLLGEYSIFCFCIYLLCYIIYFIRYFCISMKGSYTWLTDTIRLKRASPRRN